MSIILNDIDALKLQLVKDTILKKYNVVIDINYTESKVTPHFSPKYKYNCSLIVDGNDLSHMYSSFEYVDHCIEKISNMLYECNYITRNGSYSLEQCHSFEQMQMPLQKFEYFRSTSPIKFRIFTRKFRDFSTTFFASGIGICDIDMNKISDWLKENITTEYLVSGYLIGFKDDNDAGFFSLNYC